MKKKRIVQLCGRWNVSLFRDPMTFSLVDIVYLLNVQQVVMNDDYCGVTKFPIWRNLRFHEETDTFILTMSVSNVKYVSNKCEICL